MTYKYMGFFIGHWIYCTLATYNTYDYSIMALSPIHTESIACHYYYTQCTVCLQFTICALKSVSVSGTHLGSITNFSPSFFNYF
jgi:hypothetical protein